MKSRVTFLTGFALVLLILLGQASQALADAGWQQVDAALALDKDGFLEEAAVAWEEIIASQEDEGLLALAHLKLSSTYLNLGQLEKSVEIARTLTANLPNDFDAFFHLANARAKMADYPGSTRAFENTVRIRPKEGLGWVGLALALFGNGDSATALKKLKTAQSIFKKKRNIQWYQDTRILQQQIKGFAKYPPNFANLWLTNNLALVRGTYEKTIFNLDARRKAMTPPAKH